MDPEPLLTPMPPPQTLGGDALIAGNFLSDQPPCVPTPQLCGHSNVTDTALLAGQMEPYLYPSSGASTAELTCTDTVPTPDVDAFDTRSGCEEARPVIAGGVSPASCYAPHCSNLADGVNETEHSTKKNTKNKATGHGNKFPPASPKPRSKRVPRATRARPKLENEAQLSPRTRMDPVRQRDRKGRRKDRERVKSELQKAGLLETPRGRRYGRGAGEEERRERRLVQNRVSGLVTRKLAQNTLVALETKAAKLEESERVLRAFIARMKSQDLSSVPATA